MKKTLIMLILILTVTAINAQTPWRRLTISNSAGVTCTGTSFNTSSSNLYYELNKKFAITNWNGVNFQSNSQGWLSSQLTIVRTYSKLNVGAGMQYGDVQQQQFQTTTSKQLFFITTLSYNFKL